MFKVKIAMYMLKKVELFSKLTCTCKYIWTWYMYVKDEYHTYITFRKGEPPVGHRIIDDVRDDVYDHRIWHQTVTQYQD